MDDEKRLEEVQRFLQLDFDKYEQYKAITDLASELCGTPISLITLLDKDINWIKVATGASLFASPSETSFCQYSVQQEDLLIIPDASKDKRFDNNPIVHNDPKVRFYAGAPLQLSNGYRIGTLCLFDVVPRTLTPTQQKMLKMLSTQVTLLLELELSQKQLQSHIQEIEAKNESLRSIAQMQSHDIRQPLAMIIGLVNLIKEGDYSVDAEWLSMMTEATGILDEKIHSIVNESMGNKDLKLLRYNKMVEEIEDYAILLLDRNGNIENWNKGAEKIKGYRPDEIIGKNFSVFYTAADQETQLPERLLNEARQNGVARDEGWRVRKDGFTFRARVTITAIHDTSGETIGFTKVTRDLSVLK
ncbi:MAG: PAS domain S-box protein [Bacteroidetes bacterium]|nr:PAS domain S-box protein [Bacteroidota bacterium]